MSAVGIRAVLRPVPLIAAVGVFAGTVLFLFDPNRAAFYPGCMFYRLTGLLCPGCGCLRALHHLLHFHVLTALHCNPLLLISLVILAGMGLAGWWQRTSGVNGSYSPWQYLAANPAWLWAYLGLVLVFWVARNLPGPVFALLRP
jgi:hypothetical protein